MTPAEARTKWCPFAIVDNVLTHLGTINRNPDGTPATGTLCCAGDCAVWQGTDAEGHCGLTPHIPAFVGTRPR